MDRLIRLTGELDRYHGFGKPSVLLLPEASPPSRRGADFPRRRTPETKIFLAAKP
jgi:hypothetical protein